jgi:hypothetical protein
MAMASVLTRSKLLYLLPAVLLALTTRAEEPALPSPPILEGRVQWYEVEPEVNLPTEEKEIFEPTERGSLFSSPREALDAPIAAPVPPPSRPTRSPRTDRKKNWLVPGIGTRESNEEDDSGWGWLADQADAAKANEAEQPDEANSPFGYDDLGSPWPNAPIEGDTTFPSVPGPETDNDQFERWAPTLPADTVDRGNPLPQGTTADTLNRNETWLGTGVDPVRGDPDAIMPQTAALLSDITSSLREAIQPDYGLNDLMPDPTSLGLQPAEEQQPATQGSRFLQPEGEERLTPFSGETQFDR